MASTVETFILQVLMLFAGLSAGQHKAEPSGRSDAESRCFAVGKCLQRDVPSGDKKILCSALEDSMTCLNQARGACQELGMPHLVETAVNKIRDDIIVHCSEGKGTVRVLEPEVARSSEGADHNDGKVDMLSKEMRTALEKVCYSVGTCIPPNEPLGDTRQRCKEFGDSVACFQRAADACKKVDFPSEMLAATDITVKELQNNLDWHCSSDPSDPAEVDREAENREGEMKEEGEAEENDGELQKGQIVTDDAEGGATAVTASSAFSLLLSSVLLATALPHLSSSIVL